MDTIRMVTAMVMLIVRRMSSNHVGRGTIIMPIMAAMQETRIRSLDAVRIWSRFPDRISSRMRPISDCTFCSTITSTRLPHEQPSRARLGRPGGLPYAKDGVRTESCWNSVADASCAGGSRSNHTLHLAHHEIHAL